MNKLSVKINITIGLIITVIAAVLGLVYILTGDTFDGKFLGHIKDDSATNGLNDSEAPEIMAFIAGTLGMFGVMFIVVGMIIATKGMSTVEKQENKKVFSQLTIGMLVTVIAAIVLMVLAPKNDPASTFHAMWMYWAIVIALLMGAITSVIGYVQSLRNMKGPIVKNDAPKDEF